MFSRQVPVESEYSPLAWGSHGRIAAAFGNSIHFLDPATGSILATIEAAHEAPITSIEWAPKLLTAGEAHNACCSK